jgi:transcriptional regulator with XRE-family HTH domain
MSAPAGGAQQRTPTNADLGRTIRRLRKARRLSIEALAFMADMHPTYLSGIERGRRNPTWRKLCGVAEALEMPMSAMTGHAEREAKAWAMYRRALSAPLE